MNWKRMKRVLIISYYWPPAGGSGVQRWVKFSKYLPSEGWQPVIYTPSNPELIAEDRSLADDIPPEAEVIRKHIFEPYNAYRKLTGKTGSESGEVNPINAGSKTPWQRLALFVRGNFFIPDPRCFWVRPSVRFLEKYLKRHPVDIIVSTGPPHSMHLIAMKLARATGLPWVADFRDPWTRMFYFKHLSLTRWAMGRHRRLEKKVLDNASVIVAVSPLVQKEFMEMTGTRVEIERVTCNKEMKVNRVLAETFYEEMEKIPAPSYTDEELRFAAEISEAAGFDNNGVYFTGLEPLEDEPVPLAIGTDVSDVSHTVPTVMLSAACMCRDTPLHHWAATAQAGMSIGQKGMLYAAECMYRGAYRLVKEPELLRKAWQEM